MIRISHFVVYAVVLVACPVLVAQHAVTSTSSAQRVPKEVRRLAARLPGSEQRNLVDPDAESAGPENVDPFLFEMAIKNSAAWIKAVLKGEFVPDDLEGQIEGIVAGLTGPTPGRGRDAPSVAYDCTSTSFEVTGYRFVINQDSARIVVFVEPPGDDRIGDAGDTHQLARRLQEQVSALFQHAPATLYLKAIRVADFGVETTSPEDVWYHDERRWKSTVLLPAKVYEEGILTGDQEVSHQRVIERLRVVDSTMSEEQGNKWGMLWWKYAYAGTDGKVLVYIAVKTSGGQVVVAEIPDWFRLRAEDNITDGPVKGSTTRRTGPWPPE